MSAEKISVIMSVYNEPEQWLRKSIESILKQTYKNLQFVIILDNPDNEMANKVIEEYQKNDKRICYSINQKNIGLVASLNRALTLVEAEYVARMDADDIAETDRLEAEMDTLKKQNVDFVMGSIMLIDENDKEIAFPEQQEVAWKLFGKLMKYGNLSTHPTWLLKKQVYDELGGYRELTYCEDYDFIMRALQKGYRCHRLKKMLLKYRVRANGISQKYSVEQDRKARYLRYLYKKNIMIQEQTVDSINEKLSKDKDDEKYLEAVRDMEKVSILLAQGKYAEVIAKSCGYFLRNKYFRMKFIETFYCYILRKFG